MNTLVERIRRWWERTPPGFSGPVVANVLGWQLIRILWHHLVRGTGWFTPDARYREYADALRRDGVVLIPDFLPAEIFAEVRRAYEEARIGVPFKPLARPYVLPIDKKTRVEVAHFNPAPGSRLYALLDAHVMKSDLLRQLGSTVVGRRIATYRDPQVFVNRKASDTAPDLNSDIFYHADVSYPGVKAFLYLSDTGIDNGAFTYAKGTHRLTLKRFWWDYRKSIEHARNRARVGNKEIMGDETGRLWHNMTRDEEGREGIVGTPMVGRANSVVLFNVMGFHRRGDFTSDRLREFVLAYYRT